MNLRKSSRKTWMAFQCQRYLEVISFALKELSILPSTMSLSFIIINQLSSCTFIKIIFSFLQVMEEKLEISWHLADDSRRGDEIDVNWVQFAAAEGKTDYLQLLLNHG